ncbi:hypothetical protein ACFL5Y_01185 [Candidatus Omnitrophota bacterium]
MKILIRIHNSPEQRFLVSLTSQNLIDEVSKLVNKGKYSKAVVTTLSKGKFIKELAENELPRIDSDLILTEKNAHWDLL